MADAVAAPVAPAAPATPAAPAVPAAPAAPAAPAVPAAPAAPVTPVAPAAPAAPADDLIGGGDPAAEAAKAAAAAATAADVVVKVPDGVAPDDALLASFKPLAKELKLGNEGAQKLVDLYAGALQTNAQRAEEAFVQQQQAWRDSVKTDKELGGANFDGTRVEVKRFFDSFDKDGSIRKEISALGLNNHPALVRLAVRAGKALKEDSAATTSVDGGEPSDEDILKARYPSMYKP